MIFRHDSTVGSGERSCERSEREASSASGVRSDPTCEACQYLTVVPANAVSQRRERTFVETYRTRDIDDRMKGNTKRNSVTRRRDSSGCRQRPRGVDG